MLRRNHLNAAAAASHLDRPPQRLLLAFSIGPWCNGRAEEDWKRPQVSQAGALTIEAAGPGQSAFEKISPGRKAYLEPCPARAISTMWKVVSFSPVATSARSLLRSSMP